MSGYRKSLPKYAECQLQCQTGKVKAYKLMSAREVRDRNRQLVREQSSCRWVQRRSEVATAD